MFLVFFCDPDLLRGWVCGTGPNLCTKQISEISPWQKCSCELKISENFMQSEWSEEKFLKGSVG